MTSYNLIDGVHASNNKPILHDVVQVDWCTSMKMSIDFSKPNLKYKISSSNKCINAGNDFQMLGCKEN